MLVLDDALGAVVHHLVDDGRHTGLVCEGVGDVEVDRVVGEDDGVALGQLDQGLSLDTHGEGLEGNGLDVLGVGGVAEFPLLGVELAAGEVVVPDNVDGRSLDRVGEALKPLVHAFLQLRLVVGDRPVDRIHALTDNGRYGEAAAAKGDGDADTRPLLGVRVQHRHVVVLHGHSRDHDQRGHHVEVVRLVEQMVAHQVPPAGEQLGEPVCEVVDNKVPQLDERCCRLFGVKCLVEWVLLQLLRIVVVENPLLLRHEIKVVPVYDRPEVHIELD